MNTVMKVGVALVLGMGASLMAPRVALADDKCPKEKIPENIFQCDGKDADIHQLGKCEENPQNSGGIGGCIDTDGDCHVDTGFIWSRTVNNCYIKDAATGQSTLQRCEVLNFTSTGSCVEV